MLARLEGFSPVPAMPVARDPGPLMSALAPAAWNWQSKKKKSRLQNINELKEKLQVDIIWIFCLEQKKGKPRRHIFYDSSCNTNHSFITMFVLSKTAVWTDCHLTCMQYSLVCKCDSNTNFVTLTRALELALTLNIQRLRSKSWWNLKKDLKSKSNEFPK